MYSTFICVNCSRKRSSLLEIVEYCNIFCMFDKIGIKAKSKIFQRNNVTKKLSIKAINLASELSTFQTSAINMS